MSKKIKYLLFAFLGIVSAIFIFLMVLDYLTYKTCYNMPINEFYGNKMCEKYIGKGIFDK